MTAKDQLIQTISRLQLCMDGIMNELYGYVPSDDLLISVNSVAPTEKNNKATQLPILRKVLEPPCGRTTNLGITSAEATPTRLKLREFSGTFGSIVLCANLRAHANINEPN